MTLFRYRQFSQPDFETMQALDLAEQRRLTPDYDALPEREREGRLSSSLAALRHFERSGHSFVAEDTAEDGADRVRGYVLAQSVWQGDRPAVFVRALVLDDAQDEDMRRGLLRAVVKSAYDTAVYEVHLPVSPELRAAAQAEEAHLTGHYAVIHLGTRAESAPGEKLRREG